MTNILDELERRTDDDSDPWGDRQAWAVAKALPALIRVARAAKDLKRVWDQPDNYFFEEAEAELILSLQQLDNGAESTYISVSTYSNDWGIFSIPDALSPKALTEAGLTGKRIRITIQEDKP